MNFYVYYRADNGGSSLGPWRSREEARASAMATVTRLNRNGDDMLSEHPSVGNVHDEWRNGKGHMIQVVER